LNKKQFSEYIEKICKYMSLEHGFYIPDPWDKNFESWIIECEKQGLWNNYSY
jgi:hypothetical protein